MSNKQRITAFLVVLALGACSHANIRQGLPVTGADVARDAGLIVVSGVGTAIAISNIEAEDCYGGGSDSFWDSFIPNQATCTEPASNKVWSTIGAGFVVGGVYAIYSAAVGLKNLQSPTAKGEVERQTREIARWWRPERRLLWWQCWPEAGLWQNDAPRFDTVRVEGPTVVPIRWSGTCAPETHR